MQEEASMEKLVEKNAAKESLVLAKCHVGQALDVCRWSRDAKSRTDAACRMKLTTRIGKNTMNGMGWGMCNVHSS